MPFSSSRSKLGETAAWRGEEKSKLGETAAWRGEERSKLGKKSKMEQEKSRTSDR